MTAKEIRKPSVGELAAKCKPMHPDEFKKFCSQLPSHHYHWAGKVTLFLPADHATRQPYERLSPKAWKHVAIDKRGDAYDVVTAVAHSQFTPGHLKLLGIKVKMVTEGLSLDGALTIGGHLEAASERAKL